MGFTVWLQKEPKISQSVGQARAMKTQLILMNYIINQPTFAQNFKNSTEPLNLM